MKVTRPLLRENDTTDSKVSSGGTPHLYKVIWVLRSLIAAIHNLLTQIIFLSPGLGTKYLSKVLQHWFLHLIWKTVKDVWTTAFNTCQVVGDGSRNDYCGNKTFKESTFIHPPLSVKIPLKAIMVLIQIQGLWNRHYRLQALQTWALPQQIQGSHLITKYTSKAGYCL